MIRTALLFTVTIPLFSWAAPKTYPVESAWVELVGEPRAYSYLAQGEVQINAFIRREVAQFVSEFRMYGKVKRSSVNLAGSGSINCEPANCVLRDLEFIGTELRGVFYADVNKDGHFETVSQRDFRICNLKPESTELWLQDLKMFYTVDRDTNREEIEVHVKR